MCWYVEIAASESCGVSVKIKKQFKKSINTKLIQWKFQQNFAI